MRINTARLMINNIINYTLHIFQSRIYNIQMSHTIIYFDVIPTFHILYYLFHKSFNYKKKSKKESQLN